LTQAWNWMRIGISVDVFTSTAMTVPASDYDALRQFFEGIYGAEQSPVVLVRK